MNEYPGYKSKCNQCGLCCLTTPCAVSDQFGLWSEGKCKALRKGPDKYWCDAVVNPRRVSVALSKYSKAERLDAIGGSMGLCDHRAAKSIDEAEALLNQRNVADEYYNSPDDTYPRCAIVHQDGNRYVVYKRSKNSKFTIQELIV